MFSQRKEDLRKLFNHSQQILWQIPFDRARQQDKRTNGSIDRLNEQNNEKKNEKLNEQNKSSNFIFMQTSASLTDQQRIIKDVFFTFVKKFKRSHQYNE